MLQKRLKIQVGKRKEVIKGEGNFFKVFLIFSSDRKALQIMNCAF